MPTRTTIEVAPDVFVMTSVRYVTTSTMVCRGGQALLVDPAWTVGELDAIAAWLGERRLEVSAGFSTHAHHDHLLWHPAFGDAPRWASPKSVESAIEWRHELTEQLDADYPADWPNPIDGVRAVATPAVPSPFGSEIEAGAIELVVHDGHAPGHTALWIEERGVVLAGDMLSDIELPLPFTPDDLPAYLEALDILAPVVGRANVLVPGHGHPTDRPLDRLDADRRYLDAVINGDDDPDDARRALRGMAEAHSKIVAMARGTQAAD